MGPWALLGKKEHHGIIDRREGVRVVLVPDKRQKLLTGHRLRNHEGEKVLEALELHPFV